MQVRSNLIPPTQSINPSRPMSATTTAPKTHAGSKNASHAVDIEQQGSPAPSAVAPKSLGAGVSPSPVVCTSVTNISAVGLSPGCIWNHTDHLVPQSDAMARRDHHERLRGQLLLHRRIWTRHHRTMGALSGKWFRLHSIQRIRYTSLMHPVSFFPE